MPTDALGEEVLEPERQLIPVCRHGCTGEVHTAEGTRVRGKNAGLHVGKAAQSAREVALKRDGAKAERGGVGPMDAAGGAGDREEVSVDKEERRCVPYAAPAHGEHGGARGILDGEAGDDVVEDAGWETTDAVDPIGVSHRNGAGEGVGICGRRVREVDEGALRQNEHGLSIPKKLRLGTSILAMSTSMTPRPLLHSCQRRERKPKGAADRVWVSVFRVSSW